MHLEVRDERIPIRDGAPAGVGMEIDPVETERGGDERRRRLSVGPEPFSVEEELCVELARAPGPEHLVDGCLVDFQQVGNRLLVRRQADDRADVEVAVGPAVAAPADPGGEGIVDCRVTDGAGQPHRAEPVAAEEATDADDRVQLEERERHLRVVQVDFPSLDRRRDALRDPSCIDLEPDRERRLRADPRSDAAVLAPGNRAVQLQRAAPERLVAEAVEAKNLPPAGEHAARWRRGCSPRLRRRARHSRDGAVHDDDRKVEDERRSEENEQPAERPCEHVTTCLPRSEATRVRRVRSVTL